MNTCCSERKEIIHISSFFLLLCTRHSTYVQTCLMQEIIFEGQKQDVFNNILKSKLTSLTFCFSEYFLDIGSVHRPQRYIDKKTVSYSSVKYIYSEIVRSQLLFFFFWSKSSVECPSTFSFSEQN